MDIQKILALPLVKEIITRITDNCTDTTSHHDRYRFIEDICKVCYGGETKTVFLHKDWDFVIKVPNYYAYSDRNYCALEVEHYASAVAFRVERVLLETAVLIDLPNGITLYVQPRYQLDTIDYLNDDNRDSKLKKKLNNLSNKVPTYRAYRGMYDYNRISVKWFCRVVQLYGKRFARSLEEWSNQNQIGDLHNRNTGWYNNKPIILDYAGYYD